MPGALASNVLNDSDESTEFALAVTPVIYYGDSYVNIGEPFFITCIIPITEKVHWLKNGESIVRHNLRHGHDEHSYSLTETPIEGEKHKIEAHLNVRHALKVHEGRYQCNNNHRYNGGYHVLHVRSNRQDGESPTESGYQTIDELTPSSPDEIFTRTWMEQQQQQPSESQSPSHKQHKVLTHTPPMRAAGNATIADYSWPELTTLPWHTSSATALQQPHQQRRIIYSATPPDYPPPRLPLSMEHTAPPEPPTIQLYNQTLPTLPQVPNDMLDVDHDVTTSVLTTHHPHHHEQHREHQLQLPPAQPGHRSDKYQTYTPQFIPPALGGASYTLAPPKLTTGYTYTSNNVAILQQQPKTFLPIKKEQDSLVPNYDDAVHHMKFYDIRTPLVLSCDIKNADPTDVLIWKKNGTTVDKVSSLNNRHKLINAERKFIIERAEAHDDGPYSCEFKGVSKEIIAVARVIVRVPSNTGVVEGEKMMIPCSVVGSKPELSWSFGNYTNITNSTGRYILKKDDNNVENAILMIENVTLDDRGEYKCHGRNDANRANYTANVASDFTTVRVKGKFAALWPFLGICAEVLILCLIILIYEKRRNKSELEESDTDPQEQ
ncbi:Bsg [Drosophila busckii]|uniref:Bsg n=1 Tax=Drosophila busckii TaxID=30019 RepID=A0A0M4E994_DROBS|nr:Bsg [Drosophila busckii]